MHSTAADPGLFKGYEAPTPEGAPSLFEFFAVNTKLPEMVILVSKNFTIAKAKKVTFSRARPDDYWIKRFLRV